jgi:hypothetical protein
MKPTIYLMILIAALGLGRVEAQPATSHVIGQGTNSCGMWTSSRKGRQAFGMEQWILGFLSGVAETVNVTGYDPMNGIDAEAVWGWMDNYCQAHPLDMIVAAGSAFTLAHPR